MLQLYISHRLKEIAYLSDRITVLRDGTHIITELAQNMDEKKMVNFMVGRELGQYYYKANAVQDEIVLSAKNLSQKDIFENISFELHRGEILAFAGLIGAGRTEVMRVIFGADRATSGDIIIHGEKKVFKHPIDAIQAGIGLIPEDRRDQGLLLSKSVEENTGLASIKSHSPMGFVDFRWQTEAATEYVEKLRTKTPSIKTRTKNLSGGNQQKVVIAKWLAAKSNILIMDEPTRGIDVNAKAEIYALMKDFVEDGGSIIMVSSDLPEILGTANRVIIMREGEISGELSEEEASEQAIMELASFS